ncbi:Similar to hypothetical protein FOXB_14915 [Fusarium oxysporum Fo5176]; acc. no. EGU74561 [Pyronema omphalodes CBS 100304]|uniref:Uncharacterized protein n=1 Tax=Pyronema omphalodes (strain CBS 100304) TaxID=1076935 RepID=U4L658_PYROM|nr:Similar to hypothetical protein FOXB_14915 [Fusarium oxysporum Fo5176]; acc. no. EGU74561 [Pyronema omphalodes CBS 100304]
MRFVKPLITLFFTFSLFHVPISAKCYDTGIDAFAEYSAVTRARYYCFAYWDPLVLSGTWRKQETRTRCWDSTIPSYYGYRWDFQITRKGGFFDRTLALLSPKDCAQFLIEEINGCKRGGERWRGDFMFRSDPNKGFCGDNHSSESNTHFIKYKTASVSNNTSEVDDEDPMTVEKIKAMVDQWVAEHEAGFRPTEEWLREQDVKALNSTNRL